VPPSQRFARKRLAGIARVRLPSETRPEIDEVALVEIAICIAVGTETFRRKLDPDPDPDPDTDTDTDRADVCFAAKFRSCPENRFFVAAVAVRLCGKQMYGIYS